MYVHILLAMPLKALTSFPTINNHNLLTVQDIIISNPLRSAGVIELETVTLYTGPC